MFWFILFIGLALYSYSHIPKPQTQPPPGFNDVKAPTVEEGREFGVLFGTRECEGAMIAWYGDYAAIPVQKSGGKKG
jgi:hypothetical protein